MNILVVPGDGIGPEIMQASLAALALLASPATRTRDLGGTLGTQAFGKAVAQRIAET